LTTYRGLVSRWTDVREHESAALLWSFAYFFCLLCGYYVLRPVRDEMGIQAGVKNLPWLFTATFIAMLATVPLFGWVSSRLPRRRFLPYVYLFFVANLLVFFILFQYRFALDTTTKAFFVWVSVFNLFVVSVFWSFMADLYHTDQARRLYGLIAAGGSAGAIAGPALTTVLALRLGPVNLLLVSAFFLLAAVACIRQLVQWSARHGAAGGRINDAKVGGGIFDGVKLVFSSPYLMAICAYVALYSILSTFLYFQQQTIVQATLQSSEQRTALFAGLDLAVNLLTLLLQVFLFSAFLRWFGLFGGLVLLPLFSVLGFFILGLSPTLMVLAVFGVLRRAGEFAICKPARETLFNALSAEQKYKAKNFMDTTVYRGGDVVSGWLFKWLHEGVGLGLAGISYAAAPIAAVWAAVGLWLARRHKVMSRHDRERGAFADTPIVQEERP
jgi:ATP:ADP antiporter, AAA family